MSAERVDVAYALVRDAAGGRVLLVRNRDTWSLPGGRREAAETLAEAAVRETKEEAGVIVEAGPVVHVSERMDAAVHDVFTVFRADLLSGEPVAGGHDEDVVEAAWVPVEEASALMPWYRDGVAALLAATGAGYSTTRE
ncbi:NUDIX domain-containing protein [Streptomyces lydicus]|uniref:NUDIX domain-containing protein n=1 Tax=Streptomyces lydicus TaxID=47763 RepID=UPI0013E92F8A|nr:NUDIX domain-containing protein [Streptomyces lydicus]MCZ1012156.1 NUDIX domain-containing protein [Streptomyces lydicus]